MKKRAYLLVLFCWAASSLIALPSEAQPYTTKEDSLNLFDKSRNRPVPVALYLPVTSKKISRQKIIIINHGYNRNVLGANKAYSYLATKLAAEGYFVASIQHELPTDDTIPLTGIAQVVRRPFWERGVENIKFVIGELKKKYPGLDYKRLVLQGHSNGGDMVMLFAQKYPDEVDKVISFDNRRMPLPRVSQPKIYTVRSSDQPADEGVLPTEDEQKEYGITVIRQNDIVHNNMDDDATGPQRKELIDWVMVFLKK